MKSLSQTTLLLLAVVLLNTTAVFARPAKDAAITVRVRQIQSEQKQAIIQITHLPADQPVVLRIRDKQGYILHREVIQPCQDYAKKYDFSALPEGEYIAELRTKAGVITETFTLKNGQASPLYFKPAIQLQPGLIKVAFMNTMHTPLALKLYDPNDRVIYTEEVPADQKFAKALNVSRLTAGQYSLVLIGEHYVYSKSIPVH